MTYAKEYDEVEQGDRMKISEVMHSRYLERRWEDIRICEELLELQEFDAIARVGHNLKGNGKTFGHPEFSTLGEKLEKAANHRDDGQIKEILINLEAKITH